MELGNSGVSGSGKEEAVPGFVFNICFGYFMFKRLRQLTFFVCLDFSVAKGLGRGMRRHGGKKTEREYKLNTFKF